MWKKNPLPIVFQVKTKFLGAQVGLLPMCPSSPVHLPFSDTPGTPDTLLFPALELLPLFICCWTSFLQASAYIRPHQRDLPWPICIGTTSPASLCHMILFISFMTLITPCRDLFPYLFEICLLH